MSNDTQTTALHDSNSSSYAVPSDANLMIQQRRKALHILRMKQVVERTRLSRATLYVLLSTDPTFPQKIKLTARTVGFLESEIDAWIEARADARLDVQ